MFCVITNKFYIARAPVKYNYCLGNTTTNPMDLHVHAFGMLFFDGVICNIAYCVVIGRNVSR